MYLLHVQIRIVFQLKCLSKSAPIFWIGVFQVSIQLPNNDPHIYILWKRSGRIINRVHSRQKSCVFLLNQRTVVEEQENSESQCRRCQQDQTDVAGDHEISHHQGHLVLVPAVLLRWRGWGIVAPTHGPLQWPPPLQGGGDDGTRRAARGAQRPVGKNGAGGARAKDEDEGKTKSKKDA